MGIELEALEKDKAEYMERILQHEEELQVTQSRAQELQAIIVHTKGALANVYANIEAIKEQVKAEVARLKEEEHNMAAAEATKLEAADA